MPSIRITKFGGINTEVAARNSPKEVAQIAHNCLLWDGSLRPLAKWIKLSIGGYDNYSVHIAQDDKTIQVSPFKDATYLTPEVFPPSTVVGLASTKYQTVLSNVGYTSPLNPTGISYEVGVPRPALDGSSSVNYTPQHLSKKPTNRLYAVSAIRYNGVGWEESALTLIPNQNTRAVIYEGDTAAVSIVTADAAVHERTKIRLYRSISGMSTGGPVVNELDTEWFLVAELGPLKDGLASSYLYMDGAIPTASPMDMYLAKHFAPPAPDLSVNMAMTEGGWLAISTGVANSAVSDEGGGLVSAGGGSIAVSERYLYHAWPSENRISIPDDITDMVAHYDTLYVGTKNRPYAVSLATGEALGLQLGVVPFPGEYECLLDSMDVSANGAMYATNAGIIALSKQGMELITAGIASGVRPLYEAQYLDTKEILPPPIQHDIVGSTTDGLLPAGTYYYVVTVFNVNGETTKSNEKSVTNTGTTSSNTISWDHIPTATKIRVYRGTAPGVYTTYNELTLIPGDPDFFLDTNASHSFGSPPNTNTALISVQKCKELNFRDTVHGAYYNGKYFGFAHIAADHGFAVDVGYLFDTGSTLDGEHPLQKLVTFDGPPGPVIAHTESSSGLDVMSGVFAPGGGHTITNSVYTMPFPNTKQGGDYKIAPKMCYQWKSKKFVFPGNMVMAAAKVVHDCDGFVRIKFFVDCCCKYEVLVKDCKPFRLPASMQGVEWEIEVGGTATVHEIHVASSLRELLEHDRYADRGSGIIGTLNEQ